MGRKKIQIKPIKDERNRQVNISIFQTLYTDCRMLEDGYLVEYVISFSPLFLPFLGYIPEKEVWSNEESL